MGSRRGFSQISQYYDKVKLVKIGRAVVKILNFYRFEGKATVLLYFN